MGKGSGRRPLQVGQDQFNDAWDSIFQPVIPEQFFKSHIKSFGEGNENWNAVIASVYEEQCGDGVMCCDLSITNANGAVLTASLAEANESGKLTCDDDDFYYIIKPELLHEITTWALEYVSLETAGLRGEDHE